VIERFRNEDLYVLPPAHLIAPGGSRYLDHQAVRSASASILVPSRFSHDEKQSIMQVARSAHQALGMKHFSNVDLMLTSHGLYVLEVNAHPHLYEKSPLHHMLESVGSSVRDFAEHAIRLAQSH
jgi:D-alanine-D-alanine ligase